MQKVPPPPRHTTGDIPVAVFYGGVLAAVPAIVVTARRAGLDVHALADVCAPALAVGHAFGRIGCFLAGCCWGSHCSHPWAVTYTNPEAVAYPFIVPVGAPVHPVQLYEAGAELVLFGLTLWLLSRRLRTGLTWWTWVGGYAVTRFTLETFRGDPRGTSFAGLSTSQGVAVLALVVAVAAATWLLWTSRAARDESPVEPEHAPEAGPEARPEPEGGETSSAEDGVGA